MTDNTQELDEILHINGVRDYGVKVLKLIDVNEAKHAIQDWHNKQVGVVLDRLEKCLVHVDEHICRFNDGEQVCDCYLEADKITRGAIEAERNKLKEAEL